MTKRQATLLCLGLLLLGGAWLVLLPSSPELPSPSAAGHAAPTPPTPPATVPPTLAEPGTPPEPATTLAGEPTAPVQPAATIGEILTAPSPDHATTALRLTPLVLDPDRPAEERTEALSHILNLSAGQETTVLLPLIRDARLPADYCRTILDDALNQSADWQAEVYLSALRVRREPKLRTSIREHLAFLTDGGDLGDDPAAWIEPLVQAALKRTP